MHNQDETELHALTKVKAELDAYRIELANAPANDLPAEWDAVVMAEWTESLAVDISGLTAEAGFLASFWHTHHLLAHTLGDYPKAVRIYFDHASEMLANSIEARTPNA